MDQSNKYKNPFDCLQQSNSFTNHTVAVVGSIDDGGCIATLSRLFYLYGVSGSDAETYCTSTWLNMTAQALQPSVVLVKHACKYTQSIL